MPRRRRTAGLPCPARASSSPELHGKDGLQDCNVRISSRRRKQILSGSGSSCYGRRLAHDPDTRDKVRLCHRHSGLCKEPAKPGIAPSRFSAVSSAAQFFPICDAAAWKHVIFKQVLQRYLAALQCSPLASGALAHACMRGG